MKDYLFTKEPPTEAGDYYWRERDGTQAILVRICEGDGFVHATKAEGSSLVATYYGYNPQYPRSMGGEWLRIPTPDEIAAEREELAALREYYEALEVHEQIKDRISGRSMSPFDFWVRPAIERVRAARARVQALRADKEDKP